MTGRFVAFEGGDASGKTTQARRVAARLGAVFTREPGGTALGETLRALILDPVGEIDLRAEALIIAAARAQHTAEVIRPALAAGNDVVTDRFTASSLAYQGFGSGLDVAQVAALSAFATVGLEPSLTVLIDVPVPVALERLAGERDRFEREEASFHDRVRTGYLALAASDPGRWRIVDGSGDVDTVGAQVDAVIDEWWATVHS
jgi:dTMP kinase